VSDAEVPLPDSVRSREDFIDFVQKLRTAAAARPVPDWDSRNWDLDGFLDGMSAWFTDSGDRIPEAVPWSFLAKTLWAGWTYE
jgi:hypothetical protein